MILAFLLLLLVVWTGHVIPTNYMLVATRGADTLGGVPAPGYRLLRLPTYGTVGTITGKLILVPKPPLPSYYPREARQESRAGGLGPAAHRNSYEVVT